MCWGSNDLSRYYEFILGIFMGQEGDFNFSSKA